MTLTLKENLHKNVNPFIDPNQLAVDLAVDTNDLNESLSTQASLLAYYGDLSARAANQARQARHYREMVEAKVTKDVRADLLAKNGKEPPENRLDKEIVLNPSVIDAHIFYRDAMYVQDLLANVMIAFEHRRSMLLQYAKGQAQERYGSPRVMADDAIGGYAQ